PALLRDAISRTDITSGKYVRAGDRYESLWPGYSTVQAQRHTPRQDVKVHSAQLTPDHRTLVLATDALRAAVHYAVTHSSMGRPTGAGDAAGALPQQPYVDIDFDLSGVEATWTRNGQSVWKGWLPSLDLVASKKWTAGSATHDRLWTAMQERG